MEIDHHMECEQANNASRTPFCILPYAGVSWPCYPSFYPIFHKTIDTWLKLSYNVDMWSDHYTKTLC